MLEGVFEKVSWLLEVLEVSLGWFQWFSSCVIFISMFSDFLLGGFNVVQMNVEVVSAVFKEVAGVSLSHNAMLNGENICTSL